MTCRGLFCALLAMTCRPVCSDLAPGRDERAGRWGKLDGDQSNRKRGSSHKFQFRRGSENGVKGHKANARTTKGMSIYILDYCFLHLRQTGIKAIAGSQRIEAVLFLG